MKPQAELKIELVPVDELVMYDRNAKLHPSEQIDQIAESIEEFNFADPIAAWHDENGDSVIIEGHGRLMAAKKLGIEQLPVIYLDYLSDEQRRAYTLVHNKLTMNSDFDYEMLNDELDKIYDIDMSDFGFLETGLVDDNLSNDQDKYSQKITTPIYEIKGENPESNELYDDSRYETLCKEINGADIPDDIRDFLLKAATRHIVFDYGKIAEFYARQPKTIKQLMEDCTLVIIDFKKAIELGCVRTGLELSGIMEDDIAG